MKNRSLVIRLCQNKTHAIFRFLFCPPPFTKSFPPFIEITGFPSAYLYERWKALNENIYHRGILPLHNLHPTDGISLLYKTGFILCHYISFHILRMMQVKGMV